MSTEATTTSAATLTALKQMGELGYVRGILEKLDEIDVHESSCSAVTQSLRQMVQRFDLAGYTRALKELS